jgi:hypothetical protein
MTGVGAGRVLLARQADDSPEDPWIVLSGGDSRLLSGPIVTKGARIEPDLVLIGLAQLVSESA